MDLCDLHDNVTGVTVSRLTRVERFVGRDELALVRRHLVEREDRVGRARRNACAAVDAFARIDVHLRRLLEARLVAARMDAVDGTGLNAQLVFDAVVGDYVCHAGDASDEREAATFEKSPPRMMVVTPRGYLLACEIFDIRRARAPTPMLFTSAGCCA